jgi:arylformamidase
MDAPLHYVAGGRGLDEMPADVTIGLARVIGIRDREVIRPEELSKHRIRRGERILFRTRNSMRCWKADAFIEDFVYISADAARYLAGRGVRLVGVDYLSVGGFKNDGSATHRELLQAGIWIIEGLNLERVRPGPYQLVCLPLRVAHSDGAPARALVRAVSSRKGRKGKKP